MHHNMVVITGETIKFTTGIRVLPEKLPYIEKLKVYAAPEKSDF